MGLIKISNKDEKIYDRYQLVVSDSGHLTISSGDATWDKRMDRLVTSRRQEADSDGKVETAAEAGAPEDMTAECAREPMTDYEKIFQAAAQSIIDQVEAYNGGPFYIEYLISEQNKKEPLCYASITTIDEHGKELVPMDDDNTTCLELEMSFLHIKAFSAWVDYMGVVSLTVRTTNALLDEYGNVHLDLLRTIAAQAYCEANDYFDDKEAHTLYMGTFKPCC